MNVIGVHLDSIYECPFCHTEGYGYVSIEGNDTNYYDQQMEQVYFCRCDICGAEWTVTEVFTLERIEVVDVDIYPDKNELKTHFLDIEE